MHYARLKWIIASVLLCGACNAPFLKPLNIEVDYDALSAGKVIINHGSQGSLYLNVGEQRSDWLLHARNDFGPASSPRLSPDGRFLYYLKRNNFRDEFSNYRIDLSDKKLSHEKVTDVRPDFSNIDDFLRDFFYQTDPEKGFYYVRVKDNGSFLTIGEMDPTGTMEDSLYSIQHTPGLTMFLSGKDALLGFFLFGINRLDLFTMDGEYEGSVYLPLEYDYLNVVNASLSPDGTQIAISYVEMKDQNPNQIAAGYKIRVIERADLTQATSYDIPFREMNEEYDFVAPVLYHCWSPDGSRMLYHYQEEIGMLDLATGNTRTVISREEVERTSLFLIEMTWVE